MPQPGIQWLEQPADTLTLITVESCVASFTNALSCHHIAASITIAAIASVSTIGAPLASITG